MADGKAFLVVADKIDATQRTLIDNAIRSAGASVWHGMENVWVVIGGELSEWHERLSPFVPVAPGTVLVFSLPGPGSRSWNGRGQRTVWEGLLQQYASPSGRAQG